MSDTNGNGNHGTMGDALDTVDAQADLDVEKAETTALAPVERDLAQWKAQAQHGIQVAQARVEIKRQVLDLIAGEIPPRHWHNFNGRLRPDASACLRARALFGVTLDINPPERHDYTDEAGSYYVYTCSGFAEWQEMREPCYGTASSRGAFFSRSHGEPVPKDEINPSFIARQAWTECRKDGVRTILGLELDEDEHERIHGTVPKDATKDWGKGGGGGGRKEQNGQDDPETYAMRLAIGKRCMELAGGDVDTAGGFLEAVTTFKGKDGRLVKGHKSAKTMTAKHIGALHKRMEKELSREAFLGWQQGQANG